MFRKIAIESISEGNELHSLKEIERYSAELARACLAEGLDIVPSEESEVLMALGGDGMLLGCRRDYFTPKRVFWGINFGHRGFLPDDIVDPKLVAQAIASDRIFIQSFPLLSLMARDLAGNVIWTRALNDVYFNRSSRQSCRLKYEVDGTEISESMMGDGLIIATAIGSTAYNLAAGGAAVHPLLPVLSVTPNNPYAPVTIRPMIYADTQVLRVTVQEPEKRRVVVSADGSEYPDIVAATITRANVSARLGYLVEPNFTQRFVRKILRAQ